VLVFADEERLGSDVDVNFCGWYRAFAPLNMDSVTAAEWLQCLTSKLREEKEKKAIEDEEKAEKKKKRYFPEKVDV